MTPQQLIKMTKALADPTRFHLLQAIAGRGETSCGELVRQFPLAQPTISRHLKILTEAGLVEVRRQGQFNYYRMLHEVLDEYYQALDAALCGGGARDAAPPARQEAL